MFSERKTAKRNAESLNMIKHYEQKFETNTESELKNIADPKSKYVNEAKIASKNILEKKHSTQQNN